MARSFRARRSTTRSFRARRSISAQLQGASLVDAQLQGASLYGAQLQGASLQDAVLYATDLSGAWLWRTNTPTVEDIPKPAAVRLAGASWAPSWKDGEGSDHVWNGEAYQDLLREVEALPAGDPRDSALKNIRRLDCGDQDDTLAPCNGAAPPPGAVAWREALEAAAPMDHEAYAKALAQILRELVCSGGDDAIHVVRGASDGRGFLHRLEAAGLAGSGLIDDLMNKDSKDCPVAAALTDADRARLSQIKQAIGQEKK